MNLIISPKLSKFYALEHVFLMFLKKANISVVIISINYFYFRRNLFEDVSMVCDDHLAPPTGRKFSSGLDTVNNIKSVRTTNIQQ